jgi:hypothetical protein
MKNGVEKSTPFFCVGGLAGKGFFYSVNVQGKGLAATHPATAANCAPRNTQTKPLSASPALPPC